MSDFEHQKGRPLSQPTLEVSLPLEISGDWCARFNKNYGYVGKRAMLGAFDYLRQSSSMHGQRNARTNVKQMYHVSPDYPDENGLPLDGEVLVVRMVPMISEVSRDFEELAHLCLRDVIDLSDHTPAAPPHEEIWVPLESDSKFWLY